MTLRPHLIPLAPLVCAIMMAGCATQLPPSVDPPRLTLPTAATTPCRLARLDDDPTEGELEVAYIERGSALVLCDAARQLAVETLLAERALQDRWRSGEATPRNLWWPW